MEEKNETITKDKVISELIRLPKTLDSLNKELMKNEMELIESTALRKSAELRVRTSVVDADKSKESKRKPTVQERENEIRNKLRDDSEVNKLLKEEREKKMQVDTAKNDIEFVKYSHRSLIAIAHVMANTTTIIRGEGNAEDNAEQGD